MKNQALLSDSTGRPPADHVHGTLRMRLWIEDQGAVLFGLGRLMLLQQIAEAGSLKAAAEKMGMSYRAAWGKIKATEKTMGVKLIEKGSCKRAGYHLSETGAALSRQYREFFREVEDFALLRAKKMRLFDLREFEDGI